MKLSSVKTFHGENIERDGICIPFLKLVSYLSLVASLPVLLLIGYIHDIIVGTFGTPVVRTTEPKSLCLGLQAAMKPLICKTIEQTAICKK